MPFLDAGQRPDDGVVGLPVFPGVALCLLRYGPAEPEVFCQFGEPGEVLEGEGKRAFAEVGPDP